MHPAASVEGACGASLSRRRSHPVRRRYLPRAILLAFAAGAQPDKIYVHATLVAVIDSGQRGASGDPDMGCSVDRFAGDGASRRSEIEWHIRTMLGVERSSSAAPFMGAAHRASRCRRHPHHRSGADGAPARDRLRFPARARVGPITRTGLPNDSPSPAEQRAEFRAERQRAEPVSWWPAGRGARRLQQQRGA